MLRNWSRQVDVDAGKAEGLISVPSMPQPTEHTDYRGCRVDERALLDRLLPHGERLEPTVTFTDDDARRAGLDQPRADGSPSSHTKFPRNMKFARAMSNGVGLHRPDLTAGTPVYTPDELDVEDSDADVPGVDEPPPHAEAVAASDPGKSGGDGGEEAPQGGDLTDAALEGSYSAETVVELCRFYYDQPRPTRLSDEQAGEMAGRLRLARVRGVDDERLRQMADRGLRMTDVSLARHAADEWLTFRAANGTDETRSA